MRGFFLSVDTTGNKKDMDYVKNELAKYIEEVGQQNVLLLCTNNASSMLGVVRWLETKYPHLYRQGYAAHI